jgi:hypothetical protein
MLNQNSEKGFAVLPKPLVIVISLILLVLFFFYVVMPLVSYFKLAGQNIKFLYIMEQYGYLTDDEKDNLLNSLESSGFDISNVTITSTEYPVDYGEPIFLEIKYKYIFRLPFLNNSSPSSSKPDISITLSVRRNSISRH